MEQKKNFQDIYNMVCTAPKGMGIHIYDMPEYFFHDEMDNTIPHVHTFYEILWFQNDGGKHTIDFREYDIQRNTLLFISPGQVHFFDNPKACKGVILRFCTDIMGTDNRTEDMFIKYNMFNTYDGEPYYTIDDETAGRLSEIVDNMRKEQTDEQAFGHMDILLAYAKIFIIFINRYAIHHEEKKLNEQKASHRLFVMFRKMVEEKYTTMHSVKEYADSLFVSTKTLSNSVTECTGRTPLAFINNRIVIEAKRLLQYSKMTGKEIAYHLGFDDPSYFVKFFKRETGYLPSEYQPDGKGEKNR